MAEESAGTMPVVNLDRLLKLRLVVGRFGEMDMNRWWNTTGMLGKRGALVLSRGLPRTHYFAQARVVFAVAKSRCAELFDPPGCMTLWHLPAELEDQFEDRWHDWLDQRSDWDSFFQSLAELEQGQLLETLLALDLLSDTQAEEVRRLRRSAEGRAVAVPGVHEPTDDVLTILAAAFALGEPTKPAIPYARLGA